jgi:peptide/nickel transport system permease protein
MLANILIKIVRAFATLLVCVTIVFVVLRLSGDPATVMLPDDTPQDVIDEYRRIWGLDRSLFEQYLSYLAAIPNGDLGVSFTENRPAAQVVFERVPATLQLGFAALALSLSLGIPLGILAAIWRGGAMDRFVMGFAVLGFSIPNFFLAILLIVLFALNARWLPSAGSDTLSHMILPVITLASATMGKLARFTRTSTLEVLGQPFVRTAYSKGLGRLYVICRHVLPNAAIPIVTFLGFELGTVIAGAVVTESVFAWPGLGRLLVTSVAQRDLPVVQIIILLVSATLVASNLFVDLLYGWLDPRVKSFSPQGGGRT